MGRHMHLDMEVQSSEKRCGQETQMELSSSYRMGSWGGMSCKCGKGMKDGTLTHERERKGLGRLRVLYMQEKEVVSSIDLLQSAV